MAFCYCASWRRRGDVAQPVSLEHLVTSTSCLCALEGEDGAKVECRSVGLKVIIVHACMIEVILIIVYAVLEILSIRGERDCARKINEM